mgnify:CR=1 FL=1
MLTHEKETVLNKVLQLEAWIDGYWQSDKYLENSRLIINIKRNLNSIKSLINKS